MDDFASTSFTEADLLELSALCCDEDYLGFDKNNGNTWIYPTNYPVRDYQYNIVKTALFKNTLVSLPTGLGKTFIAAVVMYNYYRWYPTGKIIFVAPTKPLVAQQIDACYKIMAIPPDDTMEMTGAVAVAVRKLAWQQKRVIFATPQVIHNDLELGLCPGELIRCIVIDEAHKAKGRHSFCQIIELLSAKDHHLYRVLALSATPGSKVDDVMHVVKNLKISKMELRTEGCIDVAAYSYSRKIQTVVIPLGNELNCIRNQFIEILDVYTRRLVQFKVLTGNIGSLSKGRVIMLFKEYQLKEKSQRHPQYRQIMLDFTMVITLYHALELLTRHGARVFLNFFDEHTDKTWVGRDDRLVSFLERLRDDLGVDPMSINRNSYPDGTLPEIKENIIYGHPKFDNLKNVILEHFNTARYKGEETKAIVFCEYRESVNLVHCLLLQCGQLVKPQIFIGQGSGSGNAKDKNMKPFSQKQQLRVMTLFREGACNVLVSTCVGEEGLDIGSVDLIICFDISNKSPIRLVQRCGRTGRERSGRVVILVTEGREHQTLLECMQERDSLNKRVLQNKELQNCLYKNSPRMIPQNINPECQKMFITVKNKISAEKGKQSKKVQSKLKNMLCKSTSNNSLNTESAFISEEEFVNTYNNGFNSSNFLSHETNLWENSKAAFKSLTNESNDLTNNILSKWTEYQRSLQYTSHINHSIDSNIYSKLLQFADNKRFGVQLPTTQPDIRIHPISQTKKKTISKKQTKPVKASNDIRQLFMKIAKANNKEESLFQDKLEEILSGCGVDISSSDTINAHLNFENISMDLVNLMVELEIENSRVTDKSILYDDFPEEFIIKTKNTTLPSAVSPSYCLPDDSWVNSLCLDSLNLSLGSTEIIDAIKNDDNENFEHFECNSFIENDIIDKIDCEQSIIDEKNKSEKNNFDVIDIDAIFENSNISADNILNHNISEPDISYSPLNDTTKNPLEFFGLGDIEDMFLNDSFSKSSIEEKNTSCDNVISPIIASQVPKKRKISNGNNSVNNNFVGNDFSLKKNTCFVNDKIDSPRNRSTSPKVYENFEKLKEINQTINNGNETTFFSISQAISFINKNDPNKTENIEKEDFQSNEKTETINNVSHKNNLLENNIDLETKKEESNDSCDSIILCSQVIKPRLLSLKKTRNRVKPNIIVPASSESSDDSDILENTCANEAELKRCEIVENEPVVNSLLYDNNNGSPSMLDKRKLSSGEESSPFFHKFPKIENSSLKNLSLNRKEKKILNNITPTLSFSKNNDIFNNIKENLNPSEFTDPCSSNTNISKQIVTSFNDLSRFARNSQTMPKSMNDSFESGSFRQSYNSENSDDDFISHPKKNHNASYSIKKSTTKAKVKKKRKECEFIDYEAILSDDSYEDGSGSENLSNTRESDNSLDGFICNDNGDVHNTSVDMKAKYLQSVKSPITGKFKIPKLPEKYVDVFSQVVVEQDTSYELDSFCVGNEYGLTQVHELSELEIAESILNKRKRRKSFKKIINCNDDEEVDNLDKSSTSEHSPSEQNKKNKRVRLRINSDSSSTDDDDFL